MHLKSRKYKKKPILNKIIIIIILLFISIIYVLKIFNEKAVPLFLKYSEIEVKKIALSVLESSITEEFTNKVSIDNLFITSKDNSGNINSIDFNSVEVNRLLVSVSKVAEKNLRYLETGNLDKLNIVCYKYNNKKLKNGVIYLLPSGVIFNNTIFNNILPKIPIKLDVVGSIFSKINTDYKSYGINNSLITVNIDITVELKIILPFTMKNTKVTTSIPIIIKIIEGKIPSYYIGGNLSNPSLNIPIN